MLARPFVRCLAHGWCTNRLYRSIHATLASYAYALSKSLQKCFFSSLVVLPSAYWLVSSLAFLALTLSSSSPSKQIISSFLHSCSRRSYTCMPNSPFLWGFLSISAVIALTNFCFLHSFPALLLLKWHLLSCFGCWYEVDLIDCFVERWVKPSLWVVIQSAFLLQAICSFSSVLLACYFNVSCFPMLSTLCISIHRSLAVFPSLLFLWGCWVFLTFLSLAQLRFISTPSLFPTVLLWSSIVMVCLLPAFIFLVFLLKLFRFKAVPSQFFPYPLAPWGSSPFPVFAYWLLSALPNFATANLLLSLQCPCSIISSIHNTD